MSVDWAKVNILLDVVDGTNPAKWPNLKPIHELAMSELGLLLEDAQKEVVARREKKVAEEAAQAKKRTEPIGFPPKQPEPSTFGENGNDRRI